MSKKRGLSHDEKRERMRELFIESKSVYTLKELEKVCPKQKGIVSQTVKEVLQSLVDDALVKNDKIGTGNYFWCFPSDDLNSRNVRIEKLGTEIKSLKRKKEQLTSELEEAKKGRDISEERTKRLKKLRELEKENTQVKERLAQLAENNPELVNAMRRDAKAAKEAANRWTNNVMTLRSFCVEKFSVQEEDFNKNFQIPDDFDFLS